VPLGKNKNKISVIMDEIHEFVPAKTIVSYHSIEVEDNNEEMRFNAGICWRNVSSNITQT